MSDVAFPPRFTNMHKISFNVNKLLLGVAFYKPVLTINTLENIRITT